MLRARGVGVSAAALLFLGAGCVPLTDYRKLEERYKTQEEYVKKHKDEVKELEKQAQFLTLQAAEKQKEEELLRARLEKSERLRTQLEASRGKTMEVTSQPASTKPQTDTTFGSFKVNKDTGGIVLEHDILFAAGASTLKDSGKKVLDELVSKLNSSEYSRYEIRVDGHTDDTPVVKTVKQNHDNWELGAKRAKVVLDYLIAKGIAPKRCFFASFGPYRPMMGSITEDTTPTKHKGKEKAKHVEGAAQNRRVEIVLFEK